MSEENKKTPKEMVVDLCVKHENLVEAYNKLAEDFNKVVMAYSDIVGAVESKFPEESRHETAKRYITEREQRSSDEAKEGSDG